MQTPGLDEPLYLDFDELSYEKSLDWWKLAIGALAAARATIAADESQELADDLNLQQKDGDPIVAYGIGSDMETTPYWWFATIDSSNYTGWIRVDENTGVLWVEALKGQY